MQATDRHLDLGCGRFPRNPYGRSVLCGVDLRPPPSAVDFEHRVANLVMESIPYADNCFGSVSAFDFLEHVPRLLPTPDGKDTFFPFIRLMNDVWRVLVPGGRLYALTPAFPNAEAFSDPTHVNIITEHTHEYFCGEKPLGRMYGFEGTFRHIRVKWVDIQDAYSAIEGSAENRPAPSPAKKIARGIRHFFRWLRGKSDDHRKVYLLWEFEAVK